MTNDKKQWTFLLTDQMKIEKAMYLGQNGLKPVSEDSQALEKLQKCFKTIDNGKIKQSTSIYFVKSRKKEKGFQIFDAFRGKIKLNQYVGVLYFKDSEGEYFIRLQSRFDANDANNEGEYNTWGKGYFTRHVLSRAWDSGVNVLGEQLFRGGNTEMLRRLMAVVFLEQIRQACKKGVFRQYRSYDRNDSKVRGRIDVSRHIKENALFTGKIAYSYREYTPKNNINLLILSTYRMLEKEFPWISEMTQTKRGVKDYIDQMSRIMEPVSRAQIPALVKKCNRKISHPFYHDWEKVRCIAIALQRHLGNFIGESRSEEMAGVLFDMNDAWEIYLEKIFRQYIMEHADDNNLGGLEIYPQESTDFLFPIEADDVGRETVKQKPMRSLRPDFCFEHKDANGNSYVMVCDAKNKYGWEKVIRDESYLRERQDDREINKTTEQGVREDIFQVLTYTYLLNVKVCGIICPARLKEREKGNDKTKMRGPYYVSKDCKKKFFVLGLATLPENKNDDFTEYERIMEKREEDLCEKIFDTIDLTSSDEEK